MSNIFDTYWAGGIGSDRVYGTEVTIAFIPTRDDFWKLVTPYLGGV